MPINNQTESMTLTEIKARSESMGKIIDEVVNENELLSILPLVQCNKKTHHETTLWDGDPRGSWVGVGDRIKSSHSKTRVIADTPARVRYLSKSDSDTIQIYGHISDPTERAHAEMLKRMKAEKAYQRAMSNEICQKLIYGDRATDPLTIDGLAKRYSYLRGEARISDQIIDATNGDLSKTDLTSIYMVVMDSESGVTGIYPEGTVGGLHYEDKGESEDQNEAGSKWVFNGIYTCDLGLCISSSLAVVRIANISLSSVMQDSSDLIRQLIDASERSKAIGRTYFVANGKIRTALRQGLVNKTNNFFDSENIAGKRITTFDGIPILRADAIVNTEAREVRI